MELLLLFHLGDLPPPSQALTVCQPQCVVLPHPHPHSPVATWEAYQAPSTAGRLAFGSVGHKGLRHSLATVAAGDKSSAKRAAHRQEEPFLLRVASQMQPFGIPASWPDWFGTNLSVVWSSFKRA